MSKVYFDLSKAMNEIVKKIDSFLKDNHYTGDSIDMYLAGGMAVNYYCGTRYTEDVDASFSRRILFPSEKISVDYIRMDGKKSFIYLDTNYNPIFALMHEDFEIDSLHWFQEEKNTCLINLKVLSPVDLAVSKIARFSENDRKDIKALAREGLITQESLELRANESLINYVGNLTSVKNSITMACEDIATVLNEKINIVNYPAKNKKADCSP